MRKPQMLFVIVLCAALVAGCTMVVDPSALPAAAVTDPSADAAHWQTWVLASPDALRPAAPPDAAATAAELADLTAAAAARGDDAQKTVMYWDAGAPSYRWLEALVAMYRNGPPSPFVSRSFALFNIALYDAMVATWDAKYAYSRPHPSGIATLIPMPRTPSYPSEHAAAAGAASTILAYLFPDQAEHFAAMAEDAAMSRVVAGVNYPSDVAAGLALGRAVAEQVIAQAEDDGSAAQWDGVIPTGPGKWNGTNPVAPMAGTWRTWAIAAPEAYLPPPPPAYDSAETAAELAEIKSMTRTFPIMSKAVIWHTFDRAYPFWYDFASTRLFEQHRDQDAPYAALINAALAVANYDASVACFLAKYTYWRIRPFQLDSDVTTLFPTPNHPSYPAAHACASTANSMILADFFPDSAEEILAAGHEAGESRVWAGIHYRSDIEAGAHLGAAVAKDVIAHVHAMTQTK